MIKEVLQLLALDPHYGKSETIEIAKGKYAMPKTFKQGFEQIKRQWKQK
jgi:hypothetical protein